MYNTILKCKSNKHTPFNSWRLELAPNTILTMKIISIFTQEFYDQVISLTDSTIILSISVTFASGNGVPCTLSGSQYINKDVPLSELLEILYCFWANRTAYLDGKVVAIQINYIDKGSAPVALSPPDPGTPTFIFRGDQRYPLNPIFPGVDTLFREFTCIYYFFNIFFF
jgi:hypothetical protein